MTRFPDFTMNATTLHYATPSCRTEGLARARFALVYAILNPFVLCGTFAGTIFVVNFFTGASELVGYVALALITGVFFLAPISAIFLSFRALYTGKSGHLALTVPALAINIVQILAQLGLLWFIGRLPNC